MHRFLIPLTLVALSGCGRPAAVAVDYAWVRLAAAPGRPAGGYFTLHGGPTDGTLIAVASPAVGRVELHETMATSGGAMTMTPLRQLALPAGGEVAFAPGGKHLMLFDVRPAVKPGAKLPLEFSFANGTKLAAQAVVIAAGDAPPTF